MAKKRKGPTPPRRDATPQSGFRAPSRTVQVLLAAVISGAFVVGLAALVLRDDSNSADPSLRELVENVDPGPIHVHGLGINPEDGSLFIATHTGLWRTAPGATRAERVGEGMQDTMGFTIIGPDRFLGSGHPDQEQYRNEGLPPNLGLIESTDAGRSWQSISLSGQADFHVLRSAGERVIGFDSTNERLMVSSDAGRTWAERSVPGALVDLVIDPSDESHLIASGQRGLWESSDGGRDWNAARKDAGLLAWPAPARLYLVTGAGEVRVSADGGGRWRPLGDIGGQPAALLARNAAELYVALHDGTIKQSTDGGRAWSIRSRP